MAISFALMPIAVHGQTVPPTGRRSSLLMLKEIGVGLAFALRARRSSAPRCRRGASILDTLIGFSFASLLDPMNNQQTAILGQFYTSSP